MTFLALFLLVVAALAAIAGRWTRLHPLFIALLAGLPGGLMGLLVAGLVFSPAAWPISVAAFVITAVVGSLGAFLGWLRHTYLQREI